MEVLADPGQGRGDLDAVLAQLLGPADAGEQQQLRRLDRPGGHEHLAPGPYGVQPGRGDAAVAVPDGPAGELRGGLELDVLHARAGVPVEEQPGALRVGAQGQVRPVERGLQIGGQRALAAAVGHVDVVPAGAEEAAPGPVGVEVGDLLVPQFDGRVDEGAGDRVGAVQPGVGDPLGAAGAGGGGGDVLLALQQGEVREHVLVRPAGRALVGPVVEVRGVAPDVHHDVEVAAAAGGLAARLVGAAAVEPGLRGAGVAPVHGAAEELVPGGRVVHLGRDPGAARLQDEDGGVRVLGEPVREHAARGARSHDDVVVLFHAHLCPLSPGSAPGRGPCRGSSPCRRSFRPRSGRSS